MNNFLIVLVAALAVQVCYSTTVEDAEIKLHEFRESAHREIERAFSEQLRVSNDVEQVAVATKHKGVEEIGGKTHKFESRLKSDGGVTYKCRGARNDAFHHIDKMHKNELTRCVDQQTRQTLETLNTQRLALVEYVWNAIFEEEKHIIMCGKDPKCLAAAISDIVEKTYEVGQVIKEEVQIAKHTREEELMAIKGCASRHTANAEHALGNIPTCTY